MHYKQIDFSILFDSTQTKFQHLISPKFKNSQAAIREKDNKELQKATFLIDFNFYNCDVYFIVQI